MTNIYDEQSTAGWYHINSLTGKLQTYILVLQEHFTIIISRHVLKETGRGEAGGATARQASRLAGPTRD